MLSTDTAQLVVHEYEQSDLHAAITGSQKYVIYGLNWLPMLFCHQDFSTSHIQSYTVKYDGLFAVALLICV